MVPMMVAVDGRVELQRAVQQRLDRRVRRAVHPAVQADARRGQRRLGPAADAAADQGIHPPGLQQSGQSAVSLPVCAQHPGFGDAAILHGVQFELFGAAEMLEDAAVFVSYCDFHTGWSFLLFVVFRGRRCADRGVPPPEKAYKKDSWVCRQEVIRRSVTRSSGPTVPVSKAPAGSCRASRVCSSRGLWLA